MARAAELMLADLPFISPLARLRPLQVVKRLGGNG